MIEVKGRVERFLGEVPEYFQSIYDTLVKFNVKDPNVFAAGLIYRELEPMPPFPIIKNEFGEKVAKIVYNDEFKPKIGLEDRLMSLIKGKGTREEKEKKFLAESRIGKYQILGVIVMKVANRIARLEYAVDNKKDLAPYIVNHSYFKIPAVVKDEYVRNMMAHLEKRIKEEVPKFFDFKGAKELFNKRCVRCGYLYDKMLSSPKDESVALCLKCFQKAMPIEDE